MKKDDIVQICLIAIGAGATGFALSFMVIFGIKQEALFALIGAIIGAAATIGGAAWLADRSRVIERDAEISLLVAEYLSNGVQKGPPIGVEEGPPFRII